MVDRYWNTVIAAAQSWKLTAAWNSDPIYDWKNKKSQARRSENTASNLIIIIMESIAWSQSIYSIVHSASNQLSFSWNRLVRPQLSVFFQDRIFRFFLFVSIFAYVNRSLVYGVRECNLVLLELIVFIHRISQVNWWHTHTDSLALWVNMERCPWSTNERNELKTERERITCNYMRNVIKFDWKIMIELQALITNRCNNNKRMVHAFFGKDICFCPLRTIHYKNRHRIKNRPSGVASNLGARLQCIK